MNSTHDHRSAHHGNLCDASPRRVRRAATGASRGTLIALLLLLPLLACGPRADRPDVVLIVLDTVRRDHTGLQDDSGPSYTPQLDRLAETGLVFTQAQAPAPWTVPSHASLMTGLLPSAHGCTSMTPRFREDVPTLARKLSDAGYVTAAFYSNPWLTDRLSGMLRDFGEQHVAPFTDALGLDVSNHGGPETVAAFRTWLQGRQGKEPFFVFINLLEAHVPYNPPRRYRQQHLQDLPPTDAVAVRWVHEFNARLHDPEEVDWNRVRRLYAGDVYTADEYLGRITALLRQKGLLDDSVLIVTSDHGENLGEHDLMDHQFCVCETLLDVPLLVRAPGRVAPARRDDPVMLTDVYATILDLVGLQDASPPAFSRSLLEGRLDPQRPTLAEYAGAPPTLLDFMKQLNPELDTGPLARAFVTARMGPLRLTVASDGTEWLHDLAADPGQLTDHAAAHPQAVSVLRSVLTDAGVTARVPVAAPTVFDEELREKLRALGYVH